MKSEKKFFEAMIKDSDINGSRYFMRILKLIKKSKLTKKEKEVLIKKLEDTSGLTE